MTSDRGQASVELLGSLPALLALCLVLFQFGAVGYASVLAGNAAEAGALAMAAGADVAAGARESLPGWSRAKARVTSGHGRVQVQLQPPALLSVLARKLEVTAEAAVNAP
jgi:hypothetical protein